MSRRGKGKAFLRGAAALLGAVLAFGNFGDSAFGKMDCRAAEYFYTVTFYPGNHGSFQGTGMVTVDNSASGSSYEVSTDGGAIRISGLRAGDVVGLDAAMEGAVELGEDSRYYVKGIRASGRDNSTVDASAFRVEEDRDYVVAYGIRGDLTSYVVNYQDTQGNALAPSRTYYGNVGDRPRMAYLYIEGYQPQAYNLTKTLSKNEAENVFTFVYTRVPAGGTGGGGGTGDAGTGTGGTGGTGGAGTDGAGEAGGQTPGEGGGAGNVPGDGGNVPNPDDGAGAGNADDGAGQGGDAQAPGGDQGDEALVPNDGNSGPEDEVNLDDTETPLAEFNGENGQEEASSGFRFPVWASICIALAGAAAVVAALWVMLAARKRAKAGEEHKME